MIAASIVPSDPPSIPISRATYWGLSGFYFTHFTVAGALFPYLGLYVLARGFDPGTVGELFATVTVVKLFAPYLWGMAGDRAGSRLVVIRVGALGGTVCFAGVVLEPSYWQLVALFTVYSIFWNAVLPQFEALTLSRLGPQTTRYTRIRLWGSVGYIAAVAGLGVLFEHAGVASLPGIVLALMASVFAVSWLVPAAPRERAPAQRAPGIWPRLRQPAVVGFLITGFLMQASHGTYYAFYTVYLSAHDYSRSAIGSLWALGVVSEIVLFVHMHRVLERWSVQAVVVGCVVLTGVRWLLLVWFPDYPPVVMAVQLLHAVSYGAFHAVSMLLVNRYFPGALQGRGQAIYASVSFGAGGALGSLASGYLWAALGGTTAFAFSAALTAAALAVWGRTSVSR